MSIVIRNGRVIDPASQTDRIADVLIADGRIVGVAMSTSAMRSVCEAGSITRPLRITMDMGYPITLSSTAMRTAMPFSTWLRMTER